MTPPQFFKALVDVPPQSKGDQQGLTQAAQIPALIYSLNWLILLAAIVSVANAALKARRNALK
jgi:hypothetical protein